MNHDVLWKLIDEQRARTVTMLSSLDDGDWDRPSLCQGWSVRDVAAHLTLQQAGMRDALTMVRRFPRAALRGDMNGVIAASARRRAAELSTAAIIAAIEGMIGSRRHNLGVTPYDTLIDICVHSQDIAIPLGRDLPIDATAAMTAADRIWQRGWPWYARRRHTGRRFVATDCTWLAGDGEEVRGPIVAIVLTLSGRPVGDQLAGEWLSGKRGRRID